MLQDVLSLERHSDQNQKMCSLSTIKHNSVVMYIKTFFPKLTIGYFVVYAVYNKKTNHKMLTVTTPVRITNHRVAERIIVISNTSISLIHHLLSIPEPVDTTMF